MDPTHAPDTCDGQGVISDQPTTEPPGVACTDSSGPSEGNSDSEKYTATEAPADIDTTPSADGPNASSPPSEAPTDQLDVQALERLGQEDVILKKALLGDAQPIPTPWESLGNRGGVRKQVIQEGSGDLPELHATCLVHYIGRLASSGTVFMDSKAERNGQPQTLVAGREIAQREQCLHLAVASMRVGERCVVESDPENGFGESGSFSFPNVPPNSSLVYEVELVATAPPQDKPTNQMFYEERLEAAQRQRQKANVMFGAGEFDQALQAYLVALTFVDEDFMMQLEDFFLTQAEDVKAPILLNMAACQLQMKDYNTAIRNCGKVLELCTEKGGDLKVKALFRRARAREQLGQTEDALKDLLSAHLVAPNDPAVRKEMERVKAVKKQEEKAVDKLFKNKFKKEKKPEPEEEPSPIKETVTAPVKMSRMEEIFNYLTDCIIAYIHKFIGYWTAPAARDARPL